MEHKELVDTHTHLNFKAYNDDRDEVIIRCQKAGMKAINVGAALDTSQTAVDLAKEHKFLYASIGLHPIHVFDEEMDKLDRWAADQQKSLRTNLKELDDQIKELKRQVRQTSSLPDKIALQKKGKGLEKKRDEAWRSYDQAAREIEQKKEKLIDTVEARLSQTVTNQILFQIEWKIV